MCPSSNLGSSWNAPVEYQLDIGAHNENPANNTANAKNIAMMYFGDLLIIPALAKFSSYRWSH